MKCDDCDGTGRGDAGYPCFACDGSGKRCDECGEACAADDDMCDECMEDLANG